MTIKKQYQSDIDKIMVKRYDNGDDYWTTSDRRLIKGSPFSTLNCAYMLSEMGMDGSEPVLKETADLILSSWREDGRFKLTPQGAIYPCHTINAARTLSHLGYSSDCRLKKTFEHLLEIQHSDGGWRCNKFSFGRGPETEFSNPGPTLAALDAFRFTHYLNSAEALDRAVEFLLEHWETRIPLGPCHYGIGTLFMQVTYPFFSYNLFFYVYVLSFYNRAKKDGRYLEALGVLQSRLKSGSIVVERPNQKLAGLTFCKKGEPSDLGTERYHEILKNLEHKYD
ncbi:prenyltransferase [Ruminiclostridium cellobioparum]|uniref:prenyltransferase n=1 Tax=Ruminiclostridium cellobioparum TaxID=29355 RepID=UPI000481611A|nr:prenyltransferase [Ruminiclostridium cellobioparum]